MTPEDRGPSLDMPKEEKAAVDHLLTAEELFKPLYRWQGPEACQSLGFGIAADNCLGAAGARQFIRFIRQAWAENPPLRYLDAYDRRRLRGGGPSGDDGEVLTFREIELAGDLHDAVRAAERFHRPSVIRETSE